MLSLDLIGISVCHVHCQNLYFKTQDEQCRGNGTTDGMFHGLRYFQCEDNCGLFVGLDKLSPDCQGSSLMTEPRGAKSYAKVASHGPPQSVQSHQPDNTSPADNTRSRSHLVSRPGGKESCIDPPSRPHCFEKGDRVVAFTKKGVHVRGTVRWVGRSVASQKFTITVVGIETVSTQLCCVMIVKLCCDVQLAEYINGPCYIVVWLLLCVNTQCVCKLSCNM